MVLCWKHHWRCSGSLASNLCLPTLILWSVSDPIEPALSARIARRPSRGRHRFWFSAQRKSIALGLLFRPGRLCLPKSRTALARTKLPQVSIEKVTTTGQFHEKLARDNDVAIQLSHRRGERMQGHAAWYSVFHGSDGRMVIRVVIF
jgi:hypothetical protein